MLRPIHKHRKALLVGSNSALYHVLCMILIVINVTISVKVL